MSPPGGGSREGIDRALHVWEEGSRRQACPVVELAGPVMWQHVRAIFFNNLTSLCVDETCAGGSWKWGSPSRIKEHAPLMLRASVSMTESVYLPGRSSIVPQGNGKGRGGTHIFTTSTESRPLVRRVAPLCAAKKTDFEKHPPVYMYVSCWHSSVTNNSTAAQTTRACCGRGWVHLLLSSLEKLQTFVQNRTFAEKRVTA